MSKRQLRRFSAARRHSCPRDGGAGWQGAVLLAPEGGHQRMLKTQWTRPPMAGATDMTPPPQEMLPEEKGKEKLSVAALLPAPGFHQTLPPNQSKAS